MITTSEQKRAELAAQGWLGKHSIEDYLQEAILQRPEQTAVVDPYNRQDFFDGEPCRLNYRELDQRINYLCLKLLELGAKPDDIVAMQLPNTVESVIVILACQRLGLIVSPIAIQYREHELNHIIQQISPRFFISSSNIKGVNHSQLGLQLAQQFSCLEHVLCWGTGSPAGTQPLAQLNYNEDEIQKLKHLLASTHLNPDAIVSICWTSGTEAFPKGVPRSHNHWLAVADIIVAAADLKTGDHLMNPFPMVNMGSLGGIFFPWLRVGGKMVLHQPFELNIFLQQIEQEQVHYNLAPPAVLNMLIKEDKILQSVDLSSLRSVCSGSAPLSPWMLEAWQSRFGINVINLFGANEGTTLFSSAVDVQDAELRALYFPRFGVQDLHWSSDSVIRFKTKLVNPETGKTVERLGEQGELRIWGATVFDGYYNTPELNAQAFDEEGYFRTGDLFEISGDAAKPIFYKFIGRSKEIIIRGGQNISPAEIEVLVDSHPCVAQAAVIGLTDERLGEKVCVAIVSKDNSPLSLDDIKQYLTLKGVAIYKLPEQMVQLNALPLNQLGKVLKRELRQQIELQLKK